MPIEVIEEKSIRNAIMATGGNILKAAEMLNLSRATIYRKIKKYGIETNTSRLEGDRVSV
ncbi:MAG: helix-turn-helix domain-containing protein [Thermoanaerobacteraceae bacterium]|nr:helix-turn-helix domain-containing protein [Thermoanaerobacteraceae bacterium]